ncbi:nitrite reductase large subunit [Streptomyces tsukubensis]|uniref:assimilatory sulfite reductase (ferredoxin) n=2 Tax=Streptomyces tsukubensis TaxID=83656 RepID=A0A1V4AH39_9ACTN|nr:nitrite reductase large subunit [Streptomyces tsukubensis]
MGQSENPGLSGGPRRSENTGIAEAPRRVVVVGHGMAGHRFVTTLLDRDTARAFHITVLAEEPRPAYDRVSLSAYLDGAGEEELRLPALPADDPRLTVRLGEPATALDRGARTVTTATGERIPYDELVLATGSAPFVPPVPGHDARGCFVYRTLDDLDALRVAAAASKTGTGLVVGGGLLGLEAANALRLLGLTPHVVDLAPHLMAVQLDEGGGALLGDLVTDLGLICHTGTATREITTRDGAVTGVILGDGTRVEADVVVFAAGVRPRDRLAREAGLETGPRGGVVADPATCRAPGDPHVHAIGEVAALDGRCLGLVAPGYAMAETVAARLLGDDARLPPADLSTQLKLLGVDVASFGDAKATTPGALEVVLNDPVSRTYGKLVVSDDTRTLLGGVLVGDTDGYAVLRPMVGLPLPGDPVALLAPGAADGGAGTGLDALPGAAQVCSCNAVTKDQVLRAVTEESATDVPALKACTNAGTGCGSCLPTLKQLLASAGVTQSAALCEHFALSRAELFEIVRTTGVHTFSDLLARYGRGSGCDLCKPVVASVLASLHTADHVLTDGRAGLQDTNDRHLANMQRDGTYSVVPRVPGGEITPERLIVIGEVARDFGLYTKITGGQRIDLLGARLEQLPAIWRRLIAAGFESGHAYGKALRTVKSCVGDTWCRYGVQDSVSLAVELELRYRGLRSPHKIKAGVSGCARECAEARSKDIGVIATEAGWNLYVGGNGGFRPRHAELFLTDLDTATLIRTVDRFLMFYVRTADRLQRTAGWIEAMEGGLDHLRAVIVDDSLGIHGELDAAMARHVADYRDEWSAALDDPATLARFTPYVNAPGVRDPAIEFTVERDQPVPVPSRPLLPLEVLR